MENHILYTKNVLITLLPLYFKYISYKYCEFIHKIYIIYLIFPIIMEICILPIILIKSLYVLEYGPLITDIFVVVIIIYLF